MNPKMVVVVVGSSLMLCSQAQTAQEGSFQFCNFKSAVFYSGKSTKKLMCSVLGLSFCWSPTPVEKLSEALPERFSQRRTSKTQFWYPPLRFGSRHQICESVRLYRGQKPQNREKRVLESRKPHFPSPHQRACRVKKTIFHVMPCRETGFLTRTPFCGVKGNGGLLTPKPSFPDLSRPDPCSVDFGRKTPKFWLNFAVDFLVEFFLLFFPWKKVPKNPRQTSPGNLFGKISLGFLQKPSLEILGFLTLAQGRRIRNMRCPNLNFSWFSGHTPLTLGLSVRRQIFPKVLVMKTRLSAPVPYKTPTVRGKPHEEHLGHFLRCSSSQA